GIQYVKNHAFLKSFFIFFAIFFILMAPASFLTPLQVTRSFGDDVWRLSAIEVAFSIGMMIGGGIIALWGGFTNRIKTMAFASVMMGVCTFAIGVVALVLSYLGFMALIVIMMPIFKSTASVLIREKVEKDYLGRVFGVMGMISTFMMPLG